MAVIKKQLFINIFNPLTGVKITTWINANLDNFVKKINAGLSECVIDLPYTFDYSGSDIAEGNFVEISISDNDITPGTTKLIYSGYISMIESIVSDRRESLTVHLLGFYTLLSLDILRDGLTTVVEYTAEDIGAVMRDIFSKYKIANPTSKINFTILTIPDVGEDITYSFKRTSYQDAIEKVRALAPANYYFYIDENNTVYFKAKPTTTTHTFVLGRHFSAVKAQRGVEKVKNSLLLWNGETISPIYKRYEDSNSVALYGKRTEVVDDYGISDEATADMLAANYLTENKEPEIVLTVEIFDNTENPDGKGYDLENIKPGDTCKFVGFSEGFISRYLTENMLITSIIYSLDKVELTIDPRNLGIIDWQNQTAKNIHSAVSDNAPADYTE